MCVHSCSVLVESVPPLCNESFTSSETHSLFLQFPLSVVNVKVPRGACRESTDLCTSHAPTQGFMACFLLHSFVGDVGGGNLFNLI